ncbi:hypothetical protein IKZ40_05560 [bacterium]|nr:hypothetical protein [bacterium]
MKNVFFFAALMLFAAPLLAEDHYWCEGKTVAIEKCPTNEAIRNITVELAKGADGQIVPTSMLFGVKVKKGAYELDLNVDKWLAWSRGEAGKDGLIWFTVPKGVWETFGKDGKLTLTIKDNQKSLVEPETALAVMSDCADWPGEKDCRSYFMRGIDLEGFGEHDEAIKYFKECMETYEADVWRFAHYFIRKCKLQKELDRMAQDEKLRTINNYDRALCYAQHSNLRPETLTLFKKYWELTGPKSQDKSPDSLKNWVEVRSADTGEVAQCESKLEYKDIALSNLTAVVGAEVICWSNTVFFTVEDYKKPKGSRYVRRYFKESSALDNYLNLEREKAAAVRYEKGEEVRDLLFVKEGDAFCYLKLRPEFKEHILGVLTVKDAWAPGQDQHLLVFDLPGAMIGETYPDEGEDILSFEAK